MMERSNSAIEFQNVTMAYDERVILDDVSFVVNPGETKIVMGGSGTGKSTILKLVLGLIKPQEGRILVDGDDTVTFSEHDMSQVRQKIGMVFQDGAASNNHQRARTRALEERSVIILHTGVERSGQ